MRIIIALFLMQLSLTSWATSLSPDEMKGKIQKIYQDLNVSTLDLLYGFYDKDVEFHDPISTMNGVETIKKYYANMYKNVKTIRFDFDNFVIQDQTVVATWTMTYTVDALNDGEPISVIGNSLIKFGGSENKVIYHRDYFDVGSMVYEHIPVVGFVIKKIKHKLEGEEK